MSVLDQLITADISPLARHFTHFCQQLDESASSTALFTASLLAERNTHGDTCLDLSYHANTVLLRDKDDNVLFTAPPTDSWRNDLSCQFIGTADQNRPLILDGNRLYLRRHWREEIVIAEKLLARTEPVNFDSDKLKARLSELFVPTTVDDKGTAGQKLAAAMALTRQLAVITGGPGTGKTTTVTKILALLLEQQPTMRILLAAPTGKAAARLSESIGQQTDNLTSIVAADTLKQIPCEAATLHRMLGWHADGFNYNATNPLPCDCLLIDEVSMVGQDMMANTLAALADGCRLILLGDRNQLSSVEAGSVLGDITGQSQPLTLSPQRASELQTLTGDSLICEIKAGTPAIADCIAELQYSYRFTSSGGIGLLAEAVKQADARTITSLLKNPDEKITWIEAEGREPPKRLIDLALENTRSVFNANTAAQALDEFNKARILTARAEGPWGETAIKERLEKAMREERLITTEPDRAYKGQPIIIRRNDNETGLFNGDTGILWPDEDNASNKTELCAWFEINATLQPFSLQQLPQWKTAWTLTVHRSQGSEYNNVLLVLPAIKSRVVSRELIYTGITRAKQHCTIVTTSELLNKAIKNNQPRHSGLAMRLQWLQATNS